jgi:phage recombination protein Bet
MGSPSQTNQDELAKWDSPETITNDNAKKQLEEFMADYDKNVTPVTATQVVPKEAGVSDSEKRISLIKAKVAPDATNTEFELLMYMANKFDLDPLLKEIWLVKFGNSPAQIYAGRDGYLKIAHRSGHFDGMKTVVEFDENKKPVSATCTVFRNDMGHPIESHVLFSEYTTGKNLWTSKPAVMIGKVAESVALRKAFSVSGIYDPDEMG